MYIELIAALVGCGGMLSWTAAAKLDSAAALEALSGACLIAGLSLLGIALPFAHRLGVG